jgi:hypothetical protein
MRSEKEFSRGIKVTFWVMMFCVGVMAYGGGIGWQKWRAARVALEPQTMDGEVAPEQKAEALRLLDEAIKARHEERYDAAWGLALRAQQTDPGLAGWDLLMAELAFQRRDSGAFSKHALVAELLPESAAGAKLLLVLERWRRPWGEGQSKEDSARFLADLLAQATAAQPSVDVTWFFRGDLLRLIGKPSEAHQALLGSLHRQAPWRSSAVLAAKKSFTQLESSGGAPPSRLIGAEIGLHPGDTSRERIEVSAPRGPVGQPPELEKLAKTLTVRQWQWILEDKGSQGLSFPDALPKSAEMHIPFAILPKPEFQQDHEFRGFN